MHDSRPYPIDNLFSDANKTVRASLSKIQQHAILLLKINSAVNALLPTLLHPWYRVANVRQGVLVLETASASWQMRLRYEQPQLLSSLREQILPSLLSIDIRINPNLARKQELNEQNNGNNRQIKWPLEIKPRSLSMQSALSIRHVAAYSEGKLKNTLERLAKLAGESTETAHPGK